MCQRKTVSTSCIGLWSILFQFYSGENTLADFIRNISSTKDKPLSFTVCSSDYYCYCFISNTSWPPLLLKSAGVLKKKYCDVLYLFLFVSVWFLFGQLMCYHSHKKAAWKKTVSSSCLFSRLSLFRYQCRFHLFLSVLSKFLFLLLLFFDNSINTDLMN